MNIQELARQAIERISSMSIEELEKKFVEYGYGYKPVRREESMSFVYYPKKDIYVPLEKIEHFPMREVHAANQQKFFTMENYDMELAA